MDALAQYCLRITVAGIVCGIVSNIISDKGTIGSIIKLICGVFMVLCVVGPWTNIRLNINSDLTQEFREQAEHSVIDGENSAVEAMSEIISDQIQAYILDKAESLGAQLRVQIIMTDENPPVPCGVHLSGQISPYARSVLSKYISDNLGIRAEVQKWIG